MSKYKTILKLIKTHRSQIPWAIFYNLANLNCVKWIPDGILLKFVFRITIGKPLDLVNPKTFNEKIQWLKLYDRNSKYTKLVDKYEVREYIKNAIGAKYLVPLIGVYESFSEIDFSKLPNRFVLKCTHDSGSTIICKDKSKFDINRAKRKLEKKLKINLFWKTREWPYLNIKPRIICESLLEVPGNKELIDYKIMCFNGVPRCLFLCLDRGSDSGLKVDFYDMDWNPLPFERHYPRSERVIKKPQCFDEMVNLSKILSRSIPFVRVDFYIIENKIKFSELTFYPGSGIEEFTPESFDEILGSWLDLKGLIEGN